MPGKTLSSLLVIQTAFIGDVLLVIPLLKAAKKFFPSARLSILVRPPGGNLLEPLPFLDEIIVYDKLGKDRGISALIKLTHILKDKNFDAALLPHRSFRSGYIAWRAGIPLRVGFDKGGGRIFHQRKVPYRKNIHEIERNLYLLRNLGYKGDPPDPEVVCTEDDRQTVDHLLKGTGTSPCIVLAPGSVWESKRWLPEYYTELGRKLHNAGYAVLLIGGEQDRDLCAQIALQIGSGCLDLTGRTTLRQSVALLQRCDLLITNDSAPTHLGSAAGTRVLTLFGSTTPEFGFAPYGPKGRSLGIELDCRPCTDHGRHRCPEKHFRCMRDLSPDRVFSEAMSMLEIRP